MDYIRFGRTDLKPSRIGCGCSQTASLSTRHSPAEVRATLREAFEQGINFFDTADIYGQGDSERMLGKLFCRQRSEVIFCTKAGLTLGFSQALIRRIKPFANPLLRRTQKGRARTVAARKDMEGGCYEPAYIQGRIESSLKRLQTDYIDIFLLHGPPLAVIRNPELFEMLVALKKRGLLRYAGVSCSDAETAMAALGIEAVDVIQAPVNPLETEINKKVLPQAQAKGKALIAREPFGGGRIWNYGPLIRLGRKYADRTPAQIAVQYLLQKPDVGVMLSGMTCRAHLYENIRALSLTPLSEEDIVLLERGAV